MTSVKNMAFFEEKCWKNFAVCVNSRNFALGNQEQHNIMSDDSSLSSDDECHVK